MEQKKILEIPYGTRDFLPTEAAEKRVIETKLARLFASWGYDEVVTPTIEYLETLDKGSSHNLEPHLYKLISKDNRMMALRHEMTTPIARLMGSRLQERELPLRCSYISSVFRYEQTQTGRQCEFYQAGVELMGSGSAAADAEVIALAVRSLLSAGLTDFKLCLGQVEFLSGVMEQYQLAESECEALKEAMEKHNLVLLEQLVDGLNVNDSAKKALKSLPLLNGGQEMLAKAREMALNARSRRALDNLTEIYHLLETYQVADYVQFDLGIIRDFSYYTGMVFEAYAPELGFPVCGGGRYDNLLADFGNPCPATGFALGIERVLLALERRGGGLPETPKDVYVGYGQGSLEQAVAKALELRQAGKVVELAAAPGTESEAEAMQKAGGYKDLLFLS